MGFTIVLMSWCALLVADDSFAELKRDLRSSRMEVRRAAVRALTRAAGEEARELLLAVLKDGDSRVSDIAQWHLAGAADFEWASRALFGREGLDSRSEEVGWRVAELIGRTDFEWPAERLARELKSGDDERSRLLCWSVERLARRGRIGGDAEKLRRALERLWRRSRAGGVRAAALGALGELQDPEWSARVETSLAARESELRCAAVPRIVDLDPASCSAHWRRALEDKDVGVRAAALMALREHAGAAEARELVALLERESRPRLRQHALDGLRALSGLKYRADPRPWRLWAEALDEHWRPPALAVGEQGAVSDDSRARLAGLPILSNRVCFLIDFSGSMWMPAADGSLPKDQVDALLRETLEAFDDTVYFNIVPFANEPLPWRERLVPATRKNVRSALADFERCRARGRGNFFDAFRLALADPEVDTIVTLTDGVPTGGFHSRLELVEPRVLELQRFRPVALDSILVDCSNGVRLAWERMARASGGRCIELKLP